MDPHSVATFCISLEVQVRRAGVLLKRILSETGDTAPELSAIGTYVANASLVLSLFRARVELLANKGSAHVFDTVPTEQLIEGLVAAGNVFTDLERALGELNDRLTPLRHILGLSRKVIRTIATSPSFKSISARLQVVITTITTLVTALDYNSSSWVASYLDWRHQAH